MDQNQYGALGATTTQVTTRVTTVLDLSSVRDWEAGLCSCCDDCMGCCYVCCCPCFAFCDISHSLDEYTCLLCCFPNFPQVRSKLRYFGRIHGSACCDNCCSMFCLPCVQCQMHAELKKMGVMKERGACGNLCQCPGDKECKC